MRKVVVGLALAALVAMAAVAGAGEKSAWMDMENCGMCSPLAAHPELMQNLTWEHHNLSNGIVSVTTVAPDYVKEYRAVSMEMQKAGQKMMQGEKVALCGMCTNLSGVMMKGAMPEYVKTEQGAVMVITSADAEVVAALQKWAKKTNAEMAKMGGHDHEG